MFVFALVVLGFFLGGTPSSQQELRFDEMRLTDFSIINSEIRGYFTKNRLLPGDLHTLKISDTNTNDPQNKNPYNYEILSATSYKLCTNFSVESKDTNNDSQKHKKGYDCIVYTLPNYLLIETPTPILLSPTFIPSPTILPNKIGAP